MDDVSTKIALAAILSFVLQWLKQASWFPLLTNETARLNRIASLVLAALGQLGIALACSWSDRSCTLTWPERSVFLLGLWKVGEQWAILHGWWKVTKPASQ
jgi:hypothetical protein